MELVGFKEIDTLLELKKLKESYSLNSFWDELSEDEAKELYIVRNNGYFVGAVLMSNSSEDEMFIEMIEVIKQFVGLGRKIIGKIFDDYPLVNNIVGDSLCTSIDFWERLGANFNFDENNTKYSVIEDSTTVGFELNIKDFEKFM